MTAGTIGYTPEFVKKNEEIMTKRLVEEFGKLGIPEDEIREAAHAGWLEMQKCREDIQKKGEETLEYLKKRCYIIDKRSATDRRLGPRKYGLKNNR